MSNMPMTASQSHLIDATRVDSNSLLVLNDLTIQRGDFVLAVKVALTLNVGDICHLIGANGTGKTTLLMQLAGLLPVNTGDVVYRGSSNLPIAPVYVSHQIGIHPHLNVIQNLRFLLNLYGLNPVNAQLADALAWAGLAGFEKVGSNQLSAGQTRRINLARLYLMTPEQAPLWLLDEPFTALDVAMVQRLEQRITQFASSGGAVLMTSHQTVGVVNRQLDLSNYLPPEPVDVEWDDDIYDDE